MLNKQQIPISFQQGIDLKTDPKQVVAGKFSVLENGTLQETGAVNKRIGYAEIGNELSKGIAIASYGQEIDALDGQSIWSYSDKENEFNNKGTKIAVDLETFSVAKGGESYISPDSAYNQNLFCYVYESASTSYITVVDSTSQSNILFNYALTGVKPSVRAIGNYFVVFYINGLNLNYVSILVSNPDTVSSPTTIYNSVSAYDVSQNSSNLFISTGSNADNTIRLYTLSTTLVLSSPTSIVNTDDFFKFSTYYDTVLNQLWVSFADTNNLKYLVVNSSLATVLGITNITSISGTGYGANSLYVSNGSGFVYYDSFDDIYNTYSRSLTNAGVVGSQNLFAGSVFVCSRVFVYTDHYFIVGYGGSLQPTYFIVNSSGQVVGKILQAQGRQNNDSVNLLPQVSSISSKSFMLSLEQEFFRQNLNENESNEQVVISNIGITSIILNFDELIVSKESAKNLHISGAILSMYDKENVVEHGFNVYPEGIKAPLIVNEENLGFSSGGALSEGQYQYAFTYEWFDNQGNLHRSAPSVPFTVVNNRTPQQINGSISSGSPNITSVPAIYFNSIKIGDWITGNNIQSNSRVVNLIPPGTVVMNFNATGTNIAATLQFTPNTQLLSSAVSTLKRIETNAVTRKSYFGSITSGSNQIYIYNPKGLEVGNIIQASNFTFGINALSIVSINGNILTMSGNATQTAEGIVITFDETRSSQLNQDYNIFNYQELTSLQGSLPANTYIVNSNAGTTGSDVISTINNLPTQPVLDSIGLTVVNSFMTSLSVPMLKLTEKQNVKICQYRTEANGTIFYKVAELDNDPTQDYAVFNDIVPDVSIVGNLQLYTTGGEVENIPVPNAYVITTFKNRVIVIPSENRLSWWFSKQVIPGFPAEFSDTFVKNIEEDGGGITAAATMDGNLILFKRTSIYLVSGNGPAPSGVNDDFTDAQQIVSDTGCINKKSLVLIPSGLMYQSDKGIYLLNRKLQVEYIGDEVEDYNNDLITSATMNEKMNQVRFTLLSGNVIVYDYYVDQWYTFTDYLAVDGVFHNGYFNFIKADGTVNREQAGLYTDNGAFIRLRAISSWLSFAQMQGFERLYKILILGAWKSAHTLVVKCGYDFESAFTQTTNIASATNPGVYQYRVFTTRQKCEAIRFSFEDSQSTPYGEGLSLSSFAMEVGIKKGLNKMPASKSYG